jgi:hypothetical protein
MIEHAPADDGRAFRDGTRNILELTRGTRR